MSEQVLNEIQEVITRSNKGKCSTCTKLTVVGEVDMEDI